MITPDTSDNDRDESCDGDQHTEAEFIDDNYSDQNSIFGDANIEYLTNSFSSVVQRARHAAFASSVHTTLRNDTGRAYGLAQKIDLEIPVDGNILHNRVYILPPYWRWTDPIHRSRVASASLSVVNEAVPGPRRPSVWSRGIR